MEGASRQQEAVEVLGVGRTVAEVEDVGVIVWGPHEPHTRGKVVQSGGYRWDLTTGCCLLQLRLISL